MEKSILVPRVAQIDGCPTSAHMSSLKNTNTATQHRQDTSSLPKTPVDWLSCIREKLTEQGVTGEPQNIIIDSWRHSTRRQYATCFAPWVEFCTSSNIDFTRPSIQDVLEFLTKQSQRLGYSAVASTRSALSSFITVEGQKLGDHPLVSRFFTGLFNRKPALPRYVETWDPQIILDYIVKLPDNKDLNLKVLTQKLLILMLLTSAQRTQTLKVLSIDNMLRKSDSYIFKIDSLLKQTSSHGGKQRHLEPIKFVRYSIQKKLCIVDTLDCYLERTSKFRKSNQLLLCYAKPHGPAAKATISRWVKEIMKTAGINVEVFKPHSTRSAATSAASTAGIPMDEILKTAGWRTSSVFAKFYNKPLLGAEDSFANSILSRASMST